MTPAQIEEAWLEVEGHDSHSLADYLRLALKKIENLKKEGVPGQMHDIDRSFYELTVKERDYERIRVNRLEAMLKQLEAELGKFRHNERIEKIGFCAVRDCKLCPSPYSDPPTTRTPCSTHKGFKEDCGCP